MLNDIHTFLGTPTPPAWIEAAVAQPDILLLDHRNCEYKAANNAMSLMARYQESETLVLAMARLAREELAHHEQVMKIMKRRGIAPRPLTPSRYAMRLRKLCRRTDPGMMIDILLISAFIEARSCERFGALAPHLDEELGRFYNGLLKSEMRHYLGYLKLAHLYGDAGDIARQIEIIRPVEQALIVGADTEFRFHSGPPA
ncbi:MAG TPA: tRNA-(ms[2]io[6]A)-hydroxylase [Asticcacaulis sp.]|nr:tRNA-(ms[2]io[6]A)-hydroxylase [Asticcacaulis sp.]